MGRPNLACRLTARQGELLSLLARGHSLETAAELLGLSQRRAADDLTWACRRLNARTREDAITLWVGADLLPRVW